MVLEHPNKSKVKTRADREHFVYDIELLTAKIIVFKDFFNSEQVVDSINFRVDQVISFLGVFPT